MAKDQAQRTTISVLWRTKNGLDSVKHPGQSYDGVIQDLLKFWKEKKRDYWTRRKKQKPRVPVG